MYILILQIVINVILNLTSYFNVNTTTNNNNNNNNKGERPSFSPI
jgi:hypothetical protein